MHDAPPTRTALIKVPRQSMRVEWIRDGHIGITIGNMEYVMPSGDAIELAGKIQRLVLSYGPCARAIREGGE